MISILGVELGFALPYFLAALPAMAGYLLYVYLKGGRGKRIEVASVMFLRLLKRESSARSKPRLPWRFFFELFLITLLLLGAAGLYFTNFGARVALVVDNSFSTFAREKNSDASTRFGWIQSECQRALSSAGYGTKFDLFVTSPEFKSISEGFASRSKIIELLKETKPTYANDNLTQAINKVFAREDFDQIIVVSDRQIDLDAETKAKNVTQERIKLYPYPPNETQNIAISEISIKLARMSETRSTVNARVSAFTKSAVDLEVFLDGLVEGSYRNISKKNIKIASATSKDVEFEIGSQDASAYKVRIDLLENYTHLDQDSIKEDNTAWISPQSSKGRLTLVAELSPQALGLNNISGVTFDYYSAEQYENLSEAERNKSPLIFHRYIPRMLPDQNALLIYPQISRDYLSIGAEVQGAALTNWSSAHPILNYLNLASLNLSLVVPLGKTGWGEELMRSTAGSILVAGESGDHRYAAIGFEILPFEGRNSPLSSVLLLNSLKWASDLSLTSGYSPPFVPIEMPAQVGEVTYFGAESLTPIHGRSASYITPTHSGLLLSRADSRYLAVNYFSAESNTLSQDKLTLSFSNWPTKSASGNEAVVNYLAILALLLICLDILFATRVFGTWGASRV